MIEVKNLTKRYGSTAAVDDISFNLSEGEILGFLGPNGAGKSTTMNILTGYLSSTSGTVTVNGYDILENPQEAKRCIGYLPEQPPLYLDMTVKSYLDFVFDLKQAKLPRHAHIQEVCQLVGISHVYKRMIKHLSKGYRQRVGLAQALIGNPKVLVLDEPTVGLDPGQIIEIRNMIKALSSRHTIILSSHILSEIQATCDRIIIINQGKLVADDKAENLSKKFSDDHSLALRTEGPVPEIKTALQALPGVQSVRFDGEVSPGEVVFSLSAEEGTDIRKDVFHLMVEKNWPILEMKSRELTLEEIFLKLTSSDQTSLPAPEETEQTTEKGGDMPC
ncbi:MAG TPA: ABC transporter ATP-binding protein [Firmicutes bacterium]|nr:ABC transporter ATP-binding protein [Bacillota bacterium]